MIKRTKIVCTIGPASWDYSVMKQLAKEGMDIVRLNMSHGTFEEKAAQIANVRKISKELGKPLAIIADLQGPKLRLGKIGDETGGLDPKREIKRGEVIRLSLNPIEDEIPMQFDISPYVKKGHRIFLNDGLVEVIVDKVNGKVIVAKAQNNGVISSNKGVNIPDTNIGEAAFTDKDYRDGEFALKHDVDYIAMSFVQTVSDLKTLKELIKKHKSKAQIISKIEKSEAIVNLEQIIKASDAIMVARGDLAIETSASAVPIFQQKMTKLSRQYQKPVIVATQMLESMTENPRPTRAEASDVANAVLDQVDAVMLSAESAQGKYPVEAVRTMREIIEAVEENPDYKNYIKINWQEMAVENISLNAIVSSAASISYRIKAKAIIVATTTGRTVRLLASFRPSAEIVAVTHNDQTRNALSLVWGANNTLVVEPSENLEKFEKNIMEHIKKSGAAKKGDKIVFVIGRKVGVAGTTDTIKISTL
jgi:pyruvate kinase